MLQCLTLYDDDLYDGQKGIIDYEQHLSLLKVIIDPAFECWLDKYAMNVQRKSNIGTH